MKCDYDTVTVHTEVGVFICPKCGELVLSGEEHPDYEEGEEDEEE